MAARKIPAKKMPKRPAKPRLLQWQFSRAVEQFLDPDGDADEAFDECREADWTKGELQDGIMDMLPDDPALQARAREFKVTKHPDFVEFDSGNISHAGAHFEGEISVPADLYWRVRVFAEQGEDIAKEPEEKALVLRLQCCTDDDLKDGTVREIMDGCSDSFLSHAERALDEFSRGKDWPVAVRNYVHNYVAERLHEEGE